MKIKSILRLLSFCCLGILAMNAGLLIFKKDEIFNRLISGQFVETHQTFLVSISFALLIARLFVQRRSLKSMEFTMIFFSLVCLIDEWLMYRTGSLPLAKTIQSWAFEQLPNNWIELKQQWTILLYWRVVLVFSAFTLLLLGEGLKKRWRFSQDVAAAAWAKSS